MQKICKHCRKNGKWFPTPVAELETYLNKFIKEDVGVANTTALRKNIAYNIQYLQFQSQVLFEFDVTSVIWTQTLKMQIIVGTSIVEALFYYLLTSKKMCKTTLWKKITSINSKEVKIEGGKYRIENVIFEKLETPIPQGMTLDSMIKKVRSHRFLGSEQQIYSDLNSLRELRNRVHIHDVKNDMDTDWWNVTKNEEGLFNNVLYSVFTGPFFSLTHEEKLFFSFLRNSSVCP